MDDLKIGAVSGELLTKTLILFVLRHFDAPLPSELLTDLTMDRVSDRLEYTAALGDLQRSELIVHTAEPEGYAITAFGRDTLDAVENEIPPSTRQHAARDIATVHELLRRRAAVGGSIVERDGSWLVTLTLGEDTPPDLSVAMTYPSADSAKRALRSWQSEAHNVYKYLLTLLD